MSYDTSLIFDLIEEFGHINMVLGDDSQILCLDGLIEREFDATTHTTVRDVLLYILEAQNKIPKLIMLDIEDGVRYAIERGVRGDGKTKKTSQL